MDIERITFITRASHRYRNNQFHHTWIQKKSLSSHRQRKNHFHRTWIQKESLSSHMDLERITFITWIKKGSLSSHMDFERITFIKHGSRQKCSSILPQITQGNFCKVHKLSKMATIQTCVYQNHACYILLWIGFLFKNSTWAKL